MSTTTKEKFVTALVNKKSHEDLSNCENMILEQEKFLKVVRDYAESALAGELIKMYRIIGKQICFRAEIGEYYKELNNSKQNKPLTSTKPPSGEQFIIFN